MDWKNIFAKYISDKEFVPKVYKEHIQLIKTILGGGSGIGGGGGNEQKVWINFSKEDTQTEHEEIQRN